MDFQISLGSHSPPRRRTTAHTRSSAGTAFCGTSRQWGSEQWGVPGHAQYQYKSRAIRMNVKAIPDHRAELGAGLEYVKRAGANTGRLLLNTRLRPIDGGYKSQIRVDSFLARASLAGGISYTGGTIQLANRMVISEDRGAFIDVSLKGGSARGRLPVEDYFMLGIDSETVSPLEPPTSPPTAQVTAGVRSEQTLFSSIPMSSDVSHTCRS